MSVVRGYGLNGKSWYTNVTKPQSTFVQFTVNAADAGGLGVTSVKSNGYINYLFMHTSQTPGVVAGVTNPNPPSGYGIISFTNPFNYYLGMSARVVPPTTSNSTTSVSANNVYVITALGTATLAQWQAKGLPVGITPAVGQAFVATASGTIGGSAHVGLPASTVLTVSEVGDPSTTVTNGNIAQNGGAQIIFQFNSLTVSGTITAATFTGSALAAHTHDLFLKNAAVSDGATTRVNAGTNLLGANTGSDITVAGAGANGGIVNASAGTPAGTINAQTFTNTSASGATAPADGTIVRLELIYDGSQVTIDGL